MNRCLVKIRRPSPPNNNVNTHTKQRLAVFDCCSCGKRYCCCSAEVCLCEQGLCCNSAATQGKTFTGGTLVVPQVGVWYRIPGTR